jgi:hypothetical protein
MDYSRISERVSFKFFDVFFCEGLDFMDVSEVDGDGFKLIEDVFFDGCLKI